MELLEDTAKPVPRERAGTLLDVAVEERPDASPEGGDELGPGLLEPGCEHVARGSRVREVRVEQAAIRLLRDRLAAALELAGNLGGRGRADLGELVPQARAGRARRWDEEVRHEAVQRLDGEQRHQVKPSGAVADEAVPRLVLGTCTRVGEGPDGRLGLPGRRAGETHRQHVFGSA